VGGVVRNDTTASSDGTVKCQVMHFDGLGQAVAQVSIRMTHELVCQKSIANSTLNHI
jgi:hypothetical protein